MDIVSTKIHTALKSAGATDERKERCRSSRRTRQKNNQP